MKLYIKMQKRGQVSVFIIVAILIVALIVVFFIFKNQILNGTDENISPDVKPIHDFVSQCISKVGEEGVYYIGQTGGYFYSPNISTEYGIAYYYYSGNNYMPSKVTIQNELSNYTNYMMPFCTGDFSDYKDFNINQGKIKTTTKIESGKVVYDVEYPITITRNGKTYFFKKFSSIEVPVRLELIIDLATNITQRQMLDKDEVCISCIYDWATNDDLYVEMNKYNDGEKIFTIRDDKSEISGKDYRFNFANKYS